MPDPTSADPEAIAYLHWSEAGGPNECEHGYAEGIPCPHCDGNPKQIALRAELDALRRERDQLKIDLGQKIEAEQRISAVYRARLVQTEAVVKAARADLEHDCVASPTCIEFANRPGEYSCNERDRLVLGVINALAALPEAPPVAAGSEA